MNTVNMEGTLPKRGGGIHKVHIPLVFDLCLTWLFLKHSNVVTSISLGSSGGARPFLCWPVNWVTTSGAPKEAFGKDVADQEEPTLI